MERGSTEMQKLFASVTAVALAVTIIGITIVGHSQEIVKDGVYNRMVTIKGHVEILNNPELGKTAATGQYLVFQRDGCSDCLIGTYADANGDYKIRVGRGRYRLIVYNPSPPTYDMIAPRQPRFIEATPKLEDTEFNIKLVVPSTR